MPKKKPHDPPEDKSPRKGRKNADDMRAYAAKLEARAGEFLAHADALESLQESEVEFDGIKKADLGLAKIDAFLTAQEAAIAALKRQRERNGG